MPDCASLNSLPVPLQHVFYVVFVAIPMLVTPQRSYPDLTHLFVQILYVIGIPALGEAPAMSSQSDCCAPQRSGCCGATRQLCMPVRLQRLLLRSLFVSSVDFFPLACL